MENMMKNQRNEITKNHTRIGTENMMKGRTNSMLNKGIKMGIIGMGEVGMGMDITLRSREVIIKITDMNPNIDKWLEYCASDFI